jgi:hypothetical protein
MRKKLRLPHVPYVARKIAIDLLGSNYIAFNGGIDGVARVAEEILRTNLEKERKFDEKANEMLSESLGDMDAMQVDKRNMFWLVKRRLCEENSFILDFEERFNTLAYEILEDAWKQNLIDYKISENRVRNMIYLSIIDYLKQYELIEDAVLSKIETLQKKPVVGSEEYDLIFEKFYEDELKRRGMY